jgi:hypothetical protein
MNTFLLLIGILMTLLGLLEGLWTTLWVDGNSAPFTSRFTTFTWNSFRAIFPSHKNKLLSLAGPFILLFTVLFWIVFLWFGWSFIFYSYPESLVVKADKSLPDFTDALWYVAYTMFTVGNGDFTPQGGLWQVLSSLVAFSGMAMVTLSITYILQVISAVANKRAFASQILSIGKTPEEFVSKQWTGNDFGAIELQLNSLSQQLSTLNEQHLAFPILHYYHAARGQKSQDIAVAVLDDALTIIDLAVEEKYKPAETILSSARQTVETFLETVKMAFIKAAGEAPHLPDYNALKDAGIPMVSESEYRKILEGEKDRRKLILGLINKGAWPWPTKSN